jgi:hypothetical protein
MHTCYIYALSHRCCPTRAFCRCVVAHTPRIGSNTGYGSADAVHAVHRIWFICVLAALYSCICAQPLDVYAVGSVAAVMALVTEIVKGEIVETVLLLHGTASDAVAIAAV